MQSPFEHEPGRGAEEPVDELTRLRAENALFRALAESAADIVSVIGLAGEVRKAFRTRFRHMGYDPDELVGTPFLELIHPEDRLVAIETLAALQEPGSTMTRLLRLRHLHGHYLEFECTAHNRAHDPDVGGILVHCQDVSERRALERRVQLAERMESVGRLASGVAHDFNNILAVIQLSASRALQSPDVATQQLQQIQRAADRASSLTKRLLSFARAQPQPPTSTNLCRLVKGMADTLKALLPESIGLHITTPSDPSYVMVDAAALEQVVLNLVLNARDAVSDTGRIDIAVTVPAPDSEDVEGSARNVVLSVRDNGMGMDEATRAKALEPFFTTKAVGSGTGLGLWTVHDFALRSNGTVTLSSEPGKGTLCELSLPLVDPQGRRRGSTPTLPPPAARAATILLAEDEPALRQTIAELLRDYGHRVMTAADGEEAVALAGTLSAPLDALVTDLTMPRLGGTDLAVRLREQYPHMALVFMTGYGEIADISRRFPKSSLLRKPFAAQLLLDALGRLLPE